MIAAIKRPSDQGTHANAIAIAQEVSAATTCDSDRSRGAVSAMKQTGTAKSNYQLSGMACPKIAPKSVQAYHIGQISIIAPK